MMLRCRDPFRGVGEMGVRGLPGLRSGCCGSWDEWCSHGGAVVFEEVWRAGCGSAIDRDA